MVIGFGHDRGEYTINENSVRKILFASLRVEGLWRSEGDVEGVLSDSEGVAPRRDVV
jgi:hypothetical protein